MDMNRLLALTVERSASDLHLIPDYFPTIRVHGELIQLKTLPLLNGEIVKTMIFSILSEEQKENFLVNRELDFGHDYEINQTSKLPNRFRVNVYYTRGSMAASFRLIPSDIRTVDDLFLPAILHSFTDINQGLILLTGPTGEGKSTTLAAVINEINQKYARHILTIEDPVEYVYPQGKSIISQRELGEDTHSWTIALKAALREDPDVVMIGEMRDHDTIQAALTIAETGHLVFSTVHTNSAPETVDRIVDVFPPHQQNQVRVQLASELQAVVSQRLLPRSDRTGRVAACEILVTNPAVASIVRDGKSHLLDNVIQTSANEGMILLEGYLHKLYKEGKIDRETAISHAIRPKEIRKLLE